MSVSAAPQVPRRYRYDWGYFTDWCQAHGHEPLPCDVHLVARFVTDESDVAPATLRRRVTAINSVHTRNGAPAPGTATAVRRLLSARSDLDRRAAPLAIPKIPTRGWPSGLTGRRDALLLWIVCIAGVPAAQVGRLQRSDLSLAGEAVFVGGGHGVELPVDRDDPFGIVPVWRRWAKVQSALDRVRTPAGLILALDNAAAVTRDARPVIAAPPAPEVDGALFPAFRAGMQWKTVDPAVGLTAPEVRDVLRDRLATARSLLRLEDEEEAGQDTFSDGTVPQDNPPPAVLEADYYDVGMAKRRRDATQLSDLGDVYDDLQDTTDALAARLEALLAVVDGPDDGSAGHSGTAEQ